MVTEEKNYLLSFKDHHMKNFRLIALKNVATYQHSLKTNFCMKCVSSNLFVHHSLYTLNLFKIVQYETQKQYDIVKFKDLSKHVAPCEKTVPGPHNPPALVPSPITLASPFPK